MKSFPKPLSAKEEHDYLKKAKQGDWQARQILIERNLRLVAHIAKRYSSGEKEMEDLISIGTIGLIKAVDTFQMEKGIRLATYASRCIDNAILSQMRLWFRTNPSKAEKNPNGVFWHRFPRTYAGVQTLRSLFTCFLYRCGFDNRIQ